MIEAVRRRAARTRVLVVDDDPDARVIYQAMLAHAGYVVATAHRVAEARLRVRAKRPDLVVLDFRLPDGDALDLLREWKGVPASPMDSVPVLVVTAFSDDAHVTAATLAGADAFIVKPCPPPALVALLARVLNESTPTRELPRVAVASPEDAHPVVFTYGRGSGVATLHRIDPTRFQARCETCIRPSQIVKGTLEETMRKLVALGWATGTTGAFTCPICFQRREHATHTRARTVKESE